MYSYVAIQRTRLVKSVMLVRRLWSFGDVRSCI